jgi:hypothetical protein
MSVYKELLYALSKIDTAQHPIPRKYENNGPAVGFEIGRIEDEPSIKELRAVITKYRDGGSVIESPLFKKNHGAWKFVFEALEGIDDGIKIGFIMVVTMHRDGNREYLTLKIRDPNQSWQSGIRAKNWYDD